MKTLLLGVGQQGRAALGDLVRSGAGPVVAADRDLAALEAFVRVQGFGTAVRCRGLDASDGRALEGLVAEGFDVVIDLLPSPFAAAVAAAAVRAGVHCVSSTFAPPELRALGESAEARGVALLPEFGMDPGIDLVLLGEAVRALDEVSDVVTYGAGIPAPAAADNPLRYKVSWSFAGVLRAYHRGARLVRDGVPVEVGEAEQFRPEHGHTVEVAGLGPLEAYPNGDAFQLAADLGLDPSRLRNLGRYSLRYPGHRAFWDAVAGLGLLDDGTVDLDGVAVDRRGFLAAALEPRLRYREGEQDVAIIRNEVTGLVGGRRTRLVSEVVERGDPATGSSAMGRLVGCTVSIGAQMLADGRIARRGLLSPTKNVPFEAFTSELRGRGITIARTREGVTRIP